MEMKTEKVPDIFFTTKLYLIESQKKRAGWFPALLIKFGGGSGTVKEPLFARFFQVDLMWCVGKSYFFGSL
jgi:hypothetical protein